MIAKRYVFAGPLCETPVFKMATETVALQFPFACFR
jgi:hypothetical protein